MKGIELQIVKVVTNLREADSESIARRVGVSAEYAARVCAGLLKDDYLVVGSDGQYRVTPKAQRAINPVKTRGPIPILKGGG